MHVVRLEDRGKITGYYRYDKEQNTIIKKGTNYDSEGQKAPKAKAPADKNDKILEGIAKRRD